MFSNLSDDELWDSYYEHRDYMESVSNGVVTEEFWIELNETLQDYQQEINERFGLERDDY